MMSRRWLPELSLNLPTLHFTILYFERLLALFCGYSPVLLRLLSAIKSIDFRLGHCRFFFKPALRSDLILARNFIEEKIEVCSLRSANLLTSVFWEHVKLYLMHSGLGLFDLSFLRGSTCLLIQLKKHKSTQVLLNHGFLRE